MARPTRKLLTATAIPAAATFFAYFVRDRAAAPARAA